MPPVHLDGNSITFANGTQVNFQRTLRIPEDGATHNLPPGFGPFPLERCSDFPARSLPKAWRRGDSLFMPMRNAEAMWISWKGKEAAIMVGVGGVNAISGEGFVPGGLQAEPQSYCNTRCQPWLDGIKSGRGVVRQFVATTRGSGASVESQVCGDDFQGGLQLFVCPPKRTDVVFTSCDPSSPVVVSGLPQDAEQQRLYRSPRELGLAPG